VINVEKKIVVYKPVTEFRGSGV